MAFIQTIIRRDPWDTEPRLMELGLTSQGLRRVRDASQAAKANTTAFHAANAPGTYAYHEGVWCLRDEFSGDEWEVERPGGVEAIVNLKTGVRVAFANVDKCCDINHDPRPRSSKGPEAERLCQGNLFGELPSFTKQETSIGLPIFYCMVDPDGRIELSRPTIVGKSFGPCVERIFISSGNDESVVQPARSDNDVVEITPTVTRKVS